MEDELRMFIYLDVNGNPNEPFTVLMERYFSDGMAFTPAAAKYMEELKIKTVTLRMGRGPRPI
jgi:hypothetical protein